MLWAKVIGGLIVVAALAGAVTWAANTIEKANERDEAVARAAQVEREKVELAKTFAEAQGRDVAIADEVRAFRAEESGRAEEFRAKLNAKPITREVVREVNGVQVACRERDGDRYFQLFNDAVGEPFPPP